MGSFAKRLLVTLILVPLGMWCIYQGGLALLVILTAFLAPAAWEFSHLFELSGYKPARLLVTIGTALILIARTWDGLHSTNLGLPVFAALILAAMAYHLFDFERGRDQAAVDFAISVAGLAYLGWIGSYLLMLRFLPSGIWWTFAVLPATWLGDTGGYVIGKRFGKRPLSPRLSPKKTWEGLFGGIAFAVIFGGLLGFAWQAGAGSGTPITPLNCALIGLVMSTLTVFGDLGESMIKRMSHTKDSSQLIPGHGGAFDRIDSWLWAGVIGFYMITWLWYPVF